MPPNAVPASQPLAVKVVTDRSSCLSRVEIHAPTQNARGVSLLVTFRQSGNSYRYYGVEQEVAFGLLSAGSIGVYYNYFIKGQYRSFGPI